MRSHAYPSSHLSGADQDDDDRSFLSLMRKVAEVRAQCPVVVPPLPGQIVGGKYRIEHYLGRGGMGIVFCATHIVSHKRVALKWLLSPASDSCARQRFLREAQATGRVDHPNVVNVYDVGEDQGSNYLVMELLRGETLRARLARGPLAVSEALQLLLPAMRAVAAVHRANVIHRDLKPDNIFLCADCEPERSAKVLDFGVSGILGADRAAKGSLTVDGTLLGTPAYMPPEQLQDARTADERSDLYAFGVILYEALTGRPPFDAQTYASLVLAIAHEKPRSPSELRANIPRRLERALMRSLAKDPNERHPDMDTFIAELAPHAAAEPRAQLDLTILRLSAWKLIFACVLLLSAALALRQRSDRGAPWLLDASVRIHTLRYVCGRLGVAGCARIGGAAAQRKFVKLEVRNSGSRVLGVPHGRLHNGEPLILWDTEDPDNGPADQWWHLQPNREANTYSFHNMRTGKCFEVNNNDRQRGAEIVQWECQQRPEQEFFVEPQRGDRLGWFKLRARVSGKYVTVGSAQLQNLAPIIQDDDHAADGQLLRAAGEKWGDFE